MEEDAVGHIGEQNLACELGPHLGEVDEEQAEGYLDDDGRHARVVLHLPRPKAGN